MPTAADRLAWIKTALMPGSSWPQFAKRTGVSRGTLQQAIRRTLESGSTSGKATTWAKAAEAWDVDLGWLLLGKGNPRPDMNMRDDELEGAAQVALEELQRDSSKEPAEEVDDDEPPDPRRGPPMSAQFKKDVAVIVKMRRRRLKKEEIWAGFRSAKVLDAESACDEEAVAAAVIAALEGGDTDRPLDQRRPAKAIRRVP